MEKPPVSASEASTRRRTGPPRQAEPQITAGNRRSQTEAILDRYHLHRQLGAGGFGTVWLARDDRLERDVAVKIVPRERVSTGRFEREARAAARLSHPGIVTLYEAFADDDGAYLVSEFVPGATLSELLAVGRLSDRDIVGIGIALCDALAYAHSQGVVHRDVKPSNILIPERPASPTQIAKLTDFGVARVIGGDTLTRTGDVVGTAAYMAPEQAEGIEVTAAADLYALALVLYEALTGVNPIRTSTAAERARRLGAYLPPLRRQRRDLPRELGRGIDLALRPRPRERGRLADLRQSLEVVLPEVRDDPGVVAPAWRPGPPRDPVPLNGVPLNPAPPHGAPPHRDPPRDPYPDSYRDPAHPNVQHSDQGPLEGPAARLERPSLPARVLAALAAMALVGWLLAHVVPPWALAPAAGAVLAAAIIAAVPRSGWILLTAALSLSLLLSDRPGAALLLAIGGLLPIATMPTAGAKWPLSAGAPLLGAVGLAGAWPALAARASSAWHRAALGLTGWFWLLLAEPLAGTNLFLGRPHRAPSPEIAARSLHITVHQVLEPLLGAHALAAAPVWAVAAIALPWLIRGRSLAADALRATCWVVALSVGTALATGGVAQKQALLGALLGAGIALGPSAVEAIGHRITGRSAYLEPI